MQEEAGRKCFLSVLTFIRILPLPGQCASILERDALHLNLEKNLRQAVHSCIILFVSRSIFESCCSPAENHLLLWAHDAHPSVPATVMMLTERRPSGLSCTIGHRAYSHISICIRPRTLPAKHCRECWNLFSPQGPRGRLKWISAMTHLRASSHPFSAGSFCFVRASSQLKGQ